MNCNNYQKIVHGALWYNGKILLSKRLKEGYHKGFWQDAGGKVNNGELILDAAQRELEEETGLLFRKCYFNLIDSFIYHEREIKTFLFEIRTEESFRYIKNPEPEKQSNWQLFTLEKALKLKKIVPSVKYYLESLK